MRSARRRSSQSRSREGTSVRGILRLEMGASWQRSRLPSALRPTPSPPPPCRYHTGQLLVPCLPSGLWRGRHLHWDGLRCDCTHTTHGGATIWPWPSFLGSFSQSADTLCCVGSRALSQRRDVERVLTVDSCQALLRLLLRRARRGTPRRLARPLRVDVTKAGVDAGTRDLMI